MLRDRIIDLIRAAGPIGFDRFMEMALYDPEGGYFAAGRLRSDRDGDFLTSPEVSRLFGETVARFVTAERDRIGDPFGLAEVGAGSGSLLRPLLDALDRPPDPVIAVERSGAAREALAALVPEADLAESVPPMRGVVIGNELLDNMPAALVVRRGSQWRERRVDADGTRLALREALPPPELIAWVEAHGGPVPDGGQVEVQMRAGAWVRQTLERLERGALLLVDYGDLAENLEHRRAEGTVRTYRGHHLGPDPLAQPGSTDITMDVNFTAMIAAAEAAGAIVEYLRQDEFLERWGLRDRLHGLRQEEVTASGEGRVMERLRIRSEIVGGETLLHPRGLGDFRVLICRK